MTFEHFDSYNIVTPRERERTVSIGAVLALSRQVRLLEAMKLPIAPDPDKYEMGRFVVCKNCTTIDVCEGQEQCLDYEHRGLTAEPPEC